MTDLSKHYTHWGVLECKAAVVLIQKQRAIIDRINNSVDFGDCVYQHAGNIDQAEAHVLADHIRNWLLGKESIPQ